MPPVRRAFLRIALPLLAMPLLLSSCGGDDDNDADILNPRLEGGVPLLPDPIMSLSPTFATADSVARYAKGTVVGQLNRLGLVAREIDSAHTALNGSGWEEARSGCWIRQLGVPADTSCTSALWICETDGGFSYSQILNGPCVPEKPPLSDWTSFSGFSNADASRGSFRRFKFPGLPGPGVSNEWLWEVSSDNVFVDWMFYGAGGRTAGRFAGEFRMDRRDPSVLRAEFRWSERDKWDASLAGDGRSGRMSILDLNPLSSEWRVREEIIWQPAHGTWNSYDEAGALSAARSW